MKPYEQAVDFFLRHKTELRKNAIHIFILKIYEVETSLLP